MKDMTPNRPYLLRAFNDWIVDNEMTPHIVVDANLPQVQVPQQSVKDGQIVLNINPTAVHGLLINEHQVSFSARFGGVPFEVYVPMYAISAIYARENGAGTYFPPDEYDLEALQAPNEQENEEDNRLAEVTTDSAPDDDKSASKSSSEPKKRNHLSIVK